MKADGGSVLSRFAAGVNVTDESKTVGTNVSIFCASIVVGCGVLTDAEENVGSNDVGLLVVVIVTDVGSGFNDVAGSDVVESLFGRDGAIVGSSVFLCLFRRLTGAEVVGSDVDSDTEDDVGGVEVGLSESSEINGSLVVLFLLRLVGAKVSDSVSVFDVDDAVGAVEVGLSEAKIIVGSLVFLFLSCFVGASVIISVDDGFSVAVIVGLTGFSFFVGFVGASFVGSRVNDDAVGSNEVGFSVYAASFGSLVSLFFLGFFVGSVVVGVGLLGVFLLIGFVGDIVCSGSKSDDFIGFSL